LHVTGAAEGGSVVIDRVVLFESTRFAIRAERSLRAANIPIKVVPTPRQYSTNCGVAVAFSHDVEEQVVGHLNEIGVPFSGPLDL
jgi:hypothetical protein